MLTSGQQSVLVSAINADPTLTALAAANGFPQIADAMNAASSPAVSVWRADLPSKTVLNALQASDMPTPAGLIGYVQLLLSVPVIDASNANVRASFSTCFSGKTTLANLTGLAQRTATRFEALFTTVASPANTTSVYGYLVTADDVQAALGK